MDTRFRGRLLAIAALGFAGRAVFALTSGSDGLVRAGDPRFFHQTANLLADGHGYISPVFWFANGSSAAATEHPPLWSAVLALFSVLGGRSVHAHQLVGCAVGAATVVCAGAIGRRLRGNRVGLLAATGCAAFPVFVAMDGSLMSEPLYAQCMALVVLAALRLVAEPSLRRSAVLGLAIGLCTLVRSEAILLVALAGAPVALMLRERRGLRVAVVGAVAILTIAPWCVRNSLELDHPMLVSSEDGSVLAGANCARTYSG
ncbi:MAG: glycosyltransferase family 39 protein, partial [Actinobacteria bacterium]